MELNSPHEVERLLSHARTVKDGFPDAPNLPTYETHSTFIEDSASADQFGFIRRGETSYAVARLLFELRLADHALFFSQQAIENYFKAYIKSVGGQPKTTHSLAELLKHCCAIGNGSSFIGTEYAEIIAQRFDPFNEVARYPIWKKGPKGKTWVSAYPDDMHILDYFVHRVRGLLPVPDSHSTLFRERDGVLGEFERSHPDVYGLIWKFNINEVERDKGVDHRV